MTVTIAILSFNGEEFMDELLTAVTAQNSPLEKEILVIDSGSTDRTVEIVKKHTDVRLHEISNTEFGHGKTRNLAVSLARGDFVVFLTQDAVPSHLGWLDSMIEPFGINEKVAAVFGKQIPRPHCFVTLKREVDQVFKSFGDDGSIALQRKNKLTNQLSITNNYFSDVNSAVRKSTLEKIPFQDVDYAEDQALGIDLLEAGYFKAYTPLGSVFHSHDYPLRKYSKRKFDEYVGLRESTGFVARASMRELTAGTLKASLRDWGYLVRDNDFSFVEKVHDFFLVPFYNVATRLAIRSAANTQTGTKKHAKKSLESNARAKAGK